MPQSQPSEWTYIGDNYKYILEIRMQCFKSSAVWKESNRFINSTGTSLLHIMSLVIERYCSLSGEQGFSWKWCSSKKMARVLSEERTGERECVAWWESLGVWHLWKYWENQTVWCNFLRGWWYRKKSLGIGISIQLVHS